VANWTAQLPDDERATCVEAVCRVAQVCSDTGYIEPLVELIRGWRATAEVHANPSLAALLAVEHFGPPVPVVRPLMTSESMV